MANTNAAQTLLEHARRTPDRVTLRVVPAKGDDLTLTYADLVARAAGYAAWLAQHGVRPGDVVVLIQQPGAPLLEAFWGAVLRGAVPSILPFLTEKLSPERYQHDLAALLGITQPRAIVTYPAFGEHVRLAVAQAQLRPDAKPIVLIDEGVQPVEPFGDFLWGMDRAPDDLLLLQHSSGSTGLQKGVALSHRAVFNQIDAYAQSIGLTADDSIVSWLPLYHDMGLIASFVLPVLFGVPTALMSPFDWVRAPAKLLQTITRVRGTLCWLPNFAYNFMAQKIRDSDLATVDLSSMRAFINCSEPTFAASHAAFEAKFTRFGLKPNTLATSYAMAENVFAVTQSPIGAPLAQTKQSGAALLSAGRPLTNVQLRVVDAAGSPVADEMVGEITLRSDCMLSGYYHRDDATRQALREGWYHTGDLGYLSAGELFVTGRIKDVIIVGGKNVYPQDLERLASEVPGIHPGRAVAFGVLNARAGTEDVVIVAETDLGFDGAEGGSEEAGFALGDAVRKYIATNSEVAIRTVHLVEPGWLLKTSSGKVARGANKEKYERAEAEAAEQAP